MSTDDALRGAGSLAIHRLWEKANMDKVLKDLTPAQRKSVKLMVMQRILNPGSKNALKTDFADSIFKKLYSKTRFDEDELYEVMDELHSNFYNVQKRLRDINNPANTLLLYDITSSYFEGTEAENGEYGYSRDHRPDRYQIVIGLVCNENGLPLSVKVWPGDTADKATVKKQVEQIKETFDIQKAIIIGDKGMYSETNIEHVLDHGLNYIFSVDWHIQREQLSNRTPEQLSLLDEIGVLEWEDNGTRFIGCSSQWRKERQAQKRIEGVKYVKEKLDHLQQTVAKGKYYTWNSLHKKIEDILDYAGVKGLFDFTIKPKNKDISPDEKGKFELEYSINSEAVRERKKREGKFVLETSVDKKDKTAEEIKNAFMKQPQIEKAFRNIKSLLKIRPIYHHINPRIESHVLICFLAYYLTKKAEMEFRKNDITRRSVDVIRHWEKLKLTKITLTSKNKKLNEWQWQMGETGTKIKNEISQIGWWRSIQGYKRSILSNLDE